MKKVIIKKIFKNHSSRITELEVSWDHHVSKSTIRHHLQANKLFGVWVWHRNKKDYRET